MKQITLETTIREKAGKEYCKKLRRDGLVPAVLFGKDAQSLSLQVSEKDFKKAMVVSGRNVIIELKLPAATENSPLAMVSEVQRDPLGLRILHVDFHRISLDTKVTATVPVHLHGEPKGLKRGGILEHLTWTIEIETLPLSIPDHIAVDVSDLDIDDSIAIKDLKLAEGIEILEEPDEIVAIVHAPRVLEAAEGETEAVAVAAAPVSTTQPEVIKKGKEEKEK
jgi:large subunit ribosomal protein L25